MQISKPIKKLKSQNFKLLDTFFFEFQPKKKKKKIAFTHQIICN